jgi:hypothetical protein
VVSDSGAHEAGPASVSQLPAIPPMPKVPEDRIYRDPQMVLDSGQRLSLGWQHHRKAGPSFIIIRQSWMGTLRVNERFPLTEQGWAAAWRALSDADERAAVSLAAALAQREAQRGRAAAVAALSRVAKGAPLPATFSGGSGDTALAKGGSCELRFLDDRLVVGQVGAPVAVEVRYRDAAAVEIGGPGTFGLPAGLVLSLTLALSLLGAWVGFAIHGRVGLWFGALIGGTLGALIGAGFTRTETTIRVDTGDAEYFFMHHARLPHTLRADLSAQLMAIRAARAGQPPPDQAEQGAASAADQLSRLASLLEDGLITREEFDTLKAPLIAGS